MRMAHGEVRESGFQEPGRRNRGFGWASRPDRFNRVLAGLGTIPVAVAV